MKFYLEHLPYLIEMFLISFMTLFPSVPSTSSSRLLTHQCPLPPALAPLPISAIHLQLSPPYPSMPSTSSSPCRHCLLSGGAPTAWHGSVCRVRQVALTFRPTDHTAAVTIDNRKYKLLQKCTRLCNMVSRICLYCHM